MQHSTAVSWLLAQTLWVGAHASYLLIFMPALNKIGLAPLLLKEVHDTVFPGLLVLTLMALSVQLLALCRSVPLRDCVRQLPGKLLLVALLLCMLLLFALSQQLMQQAWVRLTYGALLAIGLLLLLQPLPPAAKASSK